MNCDNKVANWYAGINVLEYLVAVVGQRGGIRGRPASTDVFETFHLRVGPLGD